MSRLGNFFREYFNLDDDRADEEEIVASITRNISFKGVNLWTLIFAILIASVGLNVNSTAVIIGAMLISPLMGPIMGVGLGIGVNDFEIVRKGLNSLLVAVIISITTSAVYFFVTPLHTVNSELLARTNPSIWDVLIAFAGGLAGIVAGTRREKSNVIPGVAIATALMPPLCTAGFGLATGHMYYFLGAIYLFFINSVFICIATVLIVRFLGFRKKEFADERKRKRVTRYIILIVIVAIAPSIWLAYRIVQKAVFEQTAEKFVRREINFSNTQVVSKSFVFNRAVHRIEVLLMGEVLDSLTIDSLRRKMPVYSLSGTELVVRQGLDARQQIDFSQIKASIMDEVFQNDALTGVLHGQNASNIYDPVSLSGELHALFPQVVSYSFSHSVFFHADSVAGRDSIMLLVANHDEAINTGDRLKLLRWLSAKYPGDSVQIVYQNLR